MYDDDNVLKPNHFNDNVQHLKELIENYVANNVEFICELPSKIGKENKRKNIRIKKLYKEVPICPFSTLNIEHIFEDIVESCCEAKDLTLESYELSRKKATKILTFLVSTSDREKSNDGVEHIPITYALKGSLLKVSIMHELIEKVRNACKENNVKILYECCDGQRSKIIFSDKEGYPLTQMQFQKKTWYEA